MVIFGDVPYVMNRSKWAIPSRKDRAVLPLPSAFAFLYWLIRPIRLLQKYRTAQRAYLRVVGGINLSLMNEGK